MAVHSGTYYNQFEDPGARRQRQVSVNIFDVVSSEGLRVARQRSVAVLDIVSTLGARNKYIVTGNPGLTVTAGQKNQRVKGGAVLSGDNNYVPPRRTPSEATWQNKFWMFSTPSQ